MADITYITGNQNKADLLAKYLGVPVKHRKIDLDEIQSLSLQEVVDHKVRQAFSYVNGPVLVEDTSLEFAALGRLPGTFIRFFVDEVPFETTCRILDGLSREATARCMFGYFDGTEPVFLEGQLKGSIAEHPAGDNGYGWDVIFMPNNHQVTRAQLDEADYKASYLQIKPISQLAALLKTV